MTTVTAPGQPDPAAVVERVHQALVRDHVYVDPSLASQVTAKQLSAMEKAATSGDQPVFVILYPFRDGDAFGGKPQDLVARLFDQHPVTGTYLTSTTQLAPLKGSDYYYGIGVDGQTYGVPGADDFELSQLEFIVEQEQLPTLGTAFARATELAAKGPQAVEQVYRPLFDAYEQAQDADTGSTTGSTSSTGSSGDGHGVVVGVGSALVAVLALVAVGVAVRRRRAAREQRTFTLPESALEHIRAAHDRRLEQQARDERLALGERIDATELHPHGPGALAAWQAVLDQYDAAGRLLEADRPDVLDVVGALVLCRRADDALDAARRERDWTPQPTCYLDPLHGTATVTRVVESAAAGARSREVPLCRQCRVDLDAGRRPDVLDVERHGRAVHYFESGFEPWASTGYGCFGDDLVAALVAARRRGR